MFVSERIGLRYFLENHYDKEKNYRMYFDTKEDTGVFIDLDLVKVPVFQGYPWYDVDYFLGLMENRKWHWKANPRYRNIYIYFIGDSCYLCDRDNIRINNFQIDYNKLQAKAEKTEYISLALN